MNIYLVRHGEAAASWQDSEDPGLSELGQQQAQRCAAGIVRHIDADTQLISSPLLRARETAGPLAETANRTVVIVDEFREIRAPVPREERQRWLHGIARQNWSEQHEVVRSWHQGVLGALRAISEPTVVFTHFMVLNAIVGALTDTDKVVSFLPDNASVTTLRWRRNELELVELGQELKTVVN